MLTSTLSKCARQLKCSARICGLTSILDMFLRNIQRTTCSIKREKQNEPRTFPTFRQCITILVLSRLVLAWTIMNGYIAMQWLSTMNMDTDTEKAINQLHSVILTLPEPQHIPRIGLTPFAQAMPESLKGGDAVDAYRRFYHKDKATFASWKYRK